MIRTQDSSNETIWIFSVLRHACLDEKSGPLYNLLYLSLPDNYRKIIVKKFCIDNNKILTKYILGVLIPRCQVSTYGLDTWQMMTDHMASLPDNPFDCVSGWHLYFNYFIPFTYFRYFETNKKKSQATIALRGFFTGQTLITK